jgi:predicted permease
MDWRVAVFAVGVSLAASVAFGLAPAVQALRVNLTESLAEDGLAPVGGGSRSRTARARLAIMAGQVAIATVLLVGALLLTRSFMALINADRGYDPSNVLTALLPLPDSSFTPARRAEMLDRVLERLKTVPGVKAAAISTRLPLLPSGETLGAFPVPARRGGGTVSAHASVREVSPGYFAALGLRMVEGRAFTDADTSASRDVLIVNRAFAQKYLDTPAVGALLPGSRTEREVVGVVENIRSGAMTEAVQPEIFMSTHQLSSGFQFDQPAIVVRTFGDPATIAPILRSIVREQDPSAALESVMTMEDRVWTSLAKPRLYALLLGGFAAFALAVAGVGLFGVLSYSVSLRSREIGVRTSLGATPWDIAGLVLRQALMVTLGGLVVGLAVSAALARYLSGLLYGVTTSDTLSFVVVAALLAIVAVCACLAPARRAARLDPVKVLR